MPKIFISATTRDLKSYRAVVAEWARTMGYDVVIQDEFPVQSGYGTIVQMLRENLDPCDAVIHLAGLYYGFEPTNRPNGEARRSYTQLEYEIAKNQRKQVFRFVARTDYKSDNAFTQTDEQAEMQERHCQRLMYGNELYYEFSNHEDLKTLLKSIYIRSTLAKPDNLPLVGTLFKGRDEFIEQLRTVLVNKPTHIAAVTAKQAIHGLGGVGKTRVAVEYAKRFSHEYTAMLFITADSPANLQRNLAGLCGALVLNLPEKDAREQEVQVAAALRWLREHSGWFLVVDNVDTPDAASEVEVLLRQLDTGHVVVTSRLSQWGGAVEELSLDVISETEARDLLLERTQGKRKPTSTDAVDAQALAMDLGRLPLALEQAGAFIAKHRGSFRDYRYRWENQREKVLAWHDQRSMRYPASVATTLQTSFELLGEDGRGLLNILCWLAPDPIPLAMIQKLTSVDDELVINFDTRPLTSVGDELVINIESGLAQLSEYSLLQWTSAEHDAVQVHRLVEEITRFRIPESDASQWLQRALNMVDDFVPEDPSCYDVRSWPGIYGPSQSHLLTLIDSAESYGLFEPTSRLMRCLAGYLESRAAWSDAEPLMRRALAIEEQSYGTEHPFVAISLENLASLLHKTNRLSEAEPLLRRALAIEDSYGTARSDILRGLASLLADTNRMPEAEPLLRRALAIDESYGTEHPAVASDLNDLALLFLNTNRMSEAEPLVRRALAIKEQAYGPEHPYVAAVLNNLASLLQKTCRLSEAEPLLRRALAIDERSYGTEHPKIAIRLNNLANLLHETNRLPEAERLMRRALAIDLHSYGTEHPSVAQKLWSLAVLMRDLDRLHEAVPLIEQAVKIYRHFETQNGYQHPHREHVYWWRDALRQAAGLPDIDPSS